jgi:hypothetical protein
VGEVAACECVESLEIRAADAPAEAAIHSFLAFLEVMAAPQYMGHFLEYL